MKRPGGVSIYHHEDRVPLHAVGRFLRRILLIWIRNPKALGFQMVSDLWVAGCDRQTPGVCSELSTEVPESHEDGGTKDGKGMCQSNFRLLDH